MSVCATTGTNGNEGKLIRTDIGIARVPIELYHGDAEQKGDCRAGDLLKGILSGFLGSLPILIFAVKKGFLVPKDVWTFDGVEEWSSGIGQGRRQGGPQSSL